MGRHLEDTTADAVLAAYEAVVALAAEDAPLGAEARAMRETFERRTGKYRSMEPGLEAFEARSRGFWDDALTTQRLGALAEPHLGEPTRTVASRFERAHRGLFEITDRDERGARLVDVWSGAELLVTYVDEPQKLSLGNTEGLVDARVVSGSARGELFVLPGAFHHPPDATPHAQKVLEAARGRGLGTRATLDALLRMELVFETSSRVKASFAYRVESLTRA
jgi:hypothetical protein